MISFLNSRSLGVRSDQEWNYFARFSLEQFNFGETPLFYREVGDLGMGMLWTIWHAGREINNTPTFCPLNWKQLLNERGKQKTAKKSPKPFLFYSCKHWTKERKPPFKLQSTKLLVCPKYQGLQLGHFERAHRGVKSSSSSALHTKEHTIVTFNK